MKNHEGQTPFDLATVSVLFNVLTLSIKLQLVLDISTSEQSLLTLNLIPAT